VPARAPAGQVASSRAAMASTASGSTGAARPCPSGSSSSAGASQPAGAGSDARRRPRRAPGRAMGAASSSRPGGLHGGGSIEPLGERGSRRHPVGRVEHRLERVDEPVGHRAVARLGEGAPAELLGLGLPRRHRVVPRRKAATDASGRSEACGWTIGLASQPAHAAVSPAPARAADRGRGGRP
jgi:hypothetical protein